LQCNFHRVNKYAINKLFLVYQIIIKQQEKIYSAISSSGYDSQTHKPAVPEAPARQQIVLNTGSDQSVLIQQALVSIFPNTPSFKNAIAFPLRFYPQPGTDVSCKREQTYRCFPPHPIREQTKSKDVPGKLIISVL